MLDVAIVRLETLTGEIRESSRDDLKSELQATGRLSLGLRTSDAWACTHLDAICPRQSEVSQEILQRASEGCAITVLHIGQLQARSLRGRLGMLG